MKRKLSRQLAWSAAIDTANRAMRRGNRRAWSEKDYDLFVQTFDKLWPEIFDTVVFPEELVRTA